MAAHNIDISPLILLLLMGVVLFVAVWVIIKFLTILARILYSIITHRGFWIVMLPLHGFFLILFMDSGSRDGVLYCLVMMIIGFSKVFLRSNSSSHSRGTSNQYYNHNHSNYSTDFNYNRQVDYSDLDLNYNQYDDFTDINYGPTDDNFFQTTSLQRPHGIMTSARHIVRNVDMEPKTERGVLCEYLTVTIVLAFVTSRSFGGHKGACH